MVQDYKSIEIDGKITFEKVAFVNEGRREKVLENQACFLFMIKGSFDVRTPINFFNLKQGDGFLSKCGEYFFEDINLDEKKAEPIEAVGIYFHPEIIKQIVKYEPIQWQKNLTNRVNIELLLEHYKKGLIHYIENPHLFDLEMRLLKVKELLLLLAQSNQAPSLHHFISALFSPHEFDFRQIIEQNIWSSLSIKELAYLCDMSLASFKRNFREIYHESPANYIKNRKLERAASLLISSHLNVNEIAYDCGFESPSSFNRSFKNRYNLTPSTYRLSQMEK